MYARQGQLHTKIQQAMEVLTRGGYTWGFLLGDVIYS